MKKLSLCCLLLLSASLGVLAKGGRLVTDSLSSAIMGKAVKFNIYLPEGYSKTGETYPCVYLLHGLKGNFASWENQGKMRAVADDIISSGMAREMVIIMPTAGAGKYREIQNGYFNLPDYPYEDFFFQEFLPAVEKKYNCGGRQGLRAVMGLSMGGGGSTVYCQKHPEMFSSCYAMSPSLHKDPEPDMPKDKYYLWLVSVRDNSALNFIDNADEGTVAALKKIRWTFDCGDDDKLLYDTVELHRKYNEKGIRNELRVRNGGHNWEYWHQALRLALPFASVNFK